MQYQCAHSVFKLNLVVVDVSGSNVKYNGSKKVMKELVCNGSLAFRLNLDSGMSSVRGPARLVSILK